MTRLQKMFVWFLKKSGIWNFVWRSFCEEYPIRMSAKTPQVHEFMEENAKAMTDMMVYGMSAVKHVPVEDWRVKGFIKK